MDNHTEHAVSAGKSHFHAPKLSIRQMMHEVDEILARLDVGIEESHSAMDKLLVQLRRAS